MYSPNNSSCSVRCLRLQIFCYNWMKIVSNFVFRWYHTHTDLTSQANHNPEPHHCNNRYKPHIVQVKVKEIPHVPPLFIRYNRAADMKLLFTVLWYDVIWCDVPLSALPIYCQCLLAHSQNTLLYLWEICNGQQWLCACLWVCVGLSCVCLVSSANVYLCSHAWKRSRVLVFPSCNYCLFV